MEVAANEVERRVTEALELVSLDLGANPELSALLLREYDLTKERVLAVTGHSRLLEDRRVLSSAIELAIRKWTLSSTYSASPPRPEGETLGRT